MKLSIIVPVLNSHEVVRRQIIHFRRMNLPDDVEILFVDDGSNPPVEHPEEPLKNFHIVRTFDYREWTWAVARNFGARMAQGEYLLMTDLDYIIPRKAIEDALAFTGDYMGFKREFGILDEKGEFSQAVEDVLAYGLIPERIPTRGMALPPHPNNFVIRKDLFFSMGGYVEDRVGKLYPQGEDNEFKRKRHQWVAEGKLKESEYRPTLYMFPNGQWCGDVDYNPFGLFHKLTRKTDKNPWVGVYRT